MYVDYPQSYVSTSPSVPITWPCTASPCTLLVFWHCDVGASHWPATSIRVGPGWRAQSEEYSLKIASFDPR